MSRLAQHQAWMLGAIREGLAAPAQAQDRLAGSPAFPAAQRLRVYQHAYRARLLQSFHAMYPGLLHALGAELLDAFALEFLAQHPPHHPSVHRAADGFIDYLRATRPCADVQGGTDPAVVIEDLAALESAMLAVSDAPGTEQAPAADAPSLRSIAREELLALRPHRPPCVQLLRCRFPVHDYLDALRKGGAPRLPAPRDCALALTRVNYRLAVRELAPVQWELLARLDGRASVGSALAEVDALGLRPAPHAELARVWVANFFAQGLLAGFSS